MSITNNNKLALFSLGLIIISMPMFSEKSALAVQFSLVEMTTDELDSEGNNFVYDSNNITTYTPTGLNNVIEFKVQQGTNPVETYTIGSGAGESNFVALEVNAVDVPYVIQPQGSRNTNPGTNFLLPNQVDYLSAGTNGLSLSTGLNKVSTQDQEVYIFPVLNIDVTKVGDDVVDILVGDIAQNQSFDKWELLNDSGVTIASLVPQPHDETNPDWITIGKQNLERVDTTTGNVSTTEGFFTNTKSTYGLALELSDFQLEPDFGSGSLTSTEAIIVSSMRISIGETPTTPPKTDYAFVAADQNSVTFDVGSSSSASVPFEFTPTLGLLLSGVGFCCYKFKNNKNTK